MLVRLRTRRNSEGTRRAGDRYCLRISNRAMGSSVLARLQILVVEDEPIIALGIAETIARAGGIIIGPAHTVSQALNLISSTTVDAAVLDYRLEKENALPIAEVLQAAGIPF